VGTQPEESGVTPPYGLNSNCLSETEGYLMKRCCLARSHVQSVADQQPDETESGRATSQILLLESNPPEPIVDEACSSTVMDT
jgi:hypothetical protein